VINTRKSKEKDMNAHGLGSTNTNKKIPVSHVDLMKHPEKMTIQFKNKFNEASRNSVDKHIKRISEVRKTSKQNRTSSILQDVKVQ
jgi:hypothetical protein